MSFGVPLLPPQRNEGTLRIHMWDWVSGQWCAHYFFPANEEAEAAAAEEEEV